MRSYLAIDIGASGGRHIYGYIDGGKLVTEEIYRFKNAPSSVGGDLVWDTDALFAEILNGLKRCGELGKIPYSIAIDTWGVDYVLLDKNKKAIYPHYCYRSDRTQSFLNAIPFEQLYRSTGIQYQPFNTVYQLLSDKAKGRLDNAEYFLMLPEYFSFLLTGEIQNEYTNATTTSLVNALTRTWDMDIIKQLNLPEKLFRPLAQPSHIIGNFKSEIATLLGYNAKVVFAASHDTASAVLALPERDAMYVSSGTWSLIGVETSPILTTQAQKANYTNEGSIGGKIRFQKNMMGMWIIQNILKESNSGKSYDELTKLAQSEAIYDWNIDIDDPSFFAPKSMTEAVKAACKNSNQPIPSSLGQLAHCVFLSLAHAYKKAFEELEILTKRCYNSLVIIGGGSQNNYLNLLTARLIKKSVITGPVEATAAGNLLVQILSSGEIAAHSGFESLIRASFDSKEIKCDV